MTSSTDALAGNRFRRLLVFGAAVLLLMAAGALAFRLIPRSPAAPIPPLAPENPAEPEIAAVVAKVRDEVLRQPRSARHWGRLGQVLAANDLDREAQICFAEAERLNPDNPRWSYYQGLFLVNQGERDAALPFLQRAVERCAVAAPDNAVPRLLLGETLLTFGRLEEAEEQFRRVLARNENDARAHYGMALAASARQDWQTSRTHLLRCLSSPFAQQKASAQLSFVSQCLGNSDDAEKFRAQAGRLPADQEWADPFVTEYLTWTATKRNRFRLAETLEASGRLREAANVVRPMLKQYPNDYLPRWFLGKILGQARETQEAEQLLREALRLAPEMVQVHHYLGSVLFAQAEAAQDGDSHRAEKLYREAVECERQALDLKPDYGLAHMTLGLSLKRLGQKMEALSAMREAVRCNPEYGELHYYLGEMLAENDRSNEACEQLKLAVEMAPPNAPWKSEAQKKLTTESQRTQRRNTEKNQKGK